MSFNTFYFVNMINIDIIYNIPVYIHSTSKYKYMAFQESQESATSV